jgi:poly-gamma-glutamate capsule biosynthesis protein CapA/YwtB (metallophosphatase superfamily)
MALELSRFAPNLDLSQRSPRPEVVRLLLLGDTYFGESYGAGRGILRSRGYSAGFQPFLHLLNRADLVMTNLETPLTKSTQSPFRHLRPYLHRGHPEKTLEALQSANIGCVNLANNHFMDYGAAGASDTLDALDAAQLPYIGAGRNAASASRPFVVSIGSFSSLKYVIVINGFGYYPTFQEQFSAYADQARPGTNALDATRLAEDIATIRLHLSSALIVLVTHWRRDYKWASRQQRALARAAVQAGCNIVLGHGSHMMQEIEFVENFPVVHGLGNFIFNSGGRYALYGAPPFSFMAEIAISITDDKPVLKLYPIFSDNRQTDYCPRYVTAEEFQQVWELQRLRSNLRDRFEDVISKGRDEVGWFLLLQGSA